MKESSLDQLNINRVYFTEFDRATYSQVAWTAEDVEAIICSLERKIKLLALTKGHVVIATSHLLESEFARELLLPCPELFSERIIIPALREDYASCTAFLEAKQNVEEKGERELYLGAGQLEMAQLLDESALPMRWHPGDTSGWFKKRLIGDLRDAGSLVAIHLRNKGLAVPDIICRELEEMPFLSRGAIYLATQRNGSLPFREIINAYADFLYYLSGAKAVQSEGVLPQENVVDFSFTDLEGKTVSLSEHEIFFKIFVDTVKTATSTHFPADFLDALTIEDTIHLHRIAQDEHFIKKYNLIQQRTKDGLTLADPERLVLLMDELQEYEQELHEQYSRTITAELPNRLRQKHMRRTGTFVNALASLIVSPYGTMADVKDVIVSGLSFTRAERVSKWIEERVRKGLHALEWCVGEKFENQPVMLRFVDEMKRRYAGKMGRD